MRRGDAQPVAAQWGLCYIGAALIPGYSGGFRLSWLQVIALGVLQGLTEFIPVSSTGHLVLVPVFWGEFSPPLFFDVAVHLGTLAAAVAFYARDVGKLLAGLGRMAKGIASKQGRRVFTEDPWARLVSLLVLGMLPTVAIALGLGEFTEHMVTMPILAAGGLLVTGVMLIVTDQLERRRASGEGSGQEDIGPGQAVGIGIGQGVAVLPGISRSGACIVAGILLGLEREFAVKFAFLLMIPTVLGAACYEGIDAVQEGIDPTLLIQSLVAAATAMVTGLGAIWFTLKVVQRRWLWAFGVYCLLLGTFGLVVLSGQGTTMAGVS